MKNNSTHRRGAPPSRNPNSRRPPNPSRRPPSGGGGRGGALEMRPNPMNAKYSGAAAPKTTDGDQEEESAFTRLLFDFDALKDPIHDPSSHSKINIAFTLIFYSAVCVYTVFASIAYVHRPEQTTFSLRETSKLPLQNIRVDMKCSTAWGCLKNATKGSSGPWKWDGAPWLRAQYSAVEEGTDRVDVGKKWTPKNFTKVPLAYSPKLDDGILIKVPFTPTTSSNCNEYGSSCMPVMKFDIKVSDRDEMGPMHIRMDLEPHQRKAVYIGVVVREHEDESTPTRYELFNQDLFYEGKNADTSASLRIKMSQFAQVFRTSRPGSIADVFGDVGGFSSIVLSICGLLCTLVGLILPS